ncbi:hypothetical protein GFGA_1d0162 [Gluconobacter frateurii NBRC 103465]|nr:hypothetical protein GFGA_1d0162 [Gluconobacter frateurii NBRC 103465]
MAHPDTGLRLPDPLMRQDSTSTPLPVIRKVLTAMRQAILPRLGIAAALTVLQEELQADTLLFSSFMPPTDDSILHKSAPFPQGLQERLQENTFVPSLAAVRFSADAKYAVLICEAIRSQSPLGLICWKKTLWSQEDIALLQTVMSLIAATQEHDALHRRVLEECHYDLASNLLNWDGLKDEMKRRTPRLDRECLPATLMVAYVPGLTDITQNIGFQAGEEALIQCIALLRKAVRPTDAIARLSGNTFALWMDGGDRFAMAERAERMTAHGIPLLIDPPMHLPLYIGLISREPNDQDSSPELLLERATQALHDALDEQKKWRFSYEAP